MEKMTGRMSLNFQEIYAAVSVSDAKSPDLVANLWGTRVYYAKSGWGKLWHIFYCVWALFFGTSLRHRKLKEALVKTERLYKEKTKEIAATFDRFNKSLTSLIEDQADFNGKHHAFLRWEITHWNDATKTFLKLIHQLKNKKILSMLHNSYGWNYAHGIPALPFYGKDLVVGLKTFQHLINIGRSLDLETPLAILRKLSQKKKLLGEEEKELKRWINAVHARERKITVRQFHKGLRALVAYIDRSLWMDGMIKPCVATLEYELVKRKCRLFRKNDPKFLRWRNGLTPGSVVECNGSKYHLMEHLGARKQGGNNVVFTLRECDDKVAVIGKNTAILGIKKKIAEEDSWGIRPATWYEVDAKGRCALVERLKESVTSLHWEGAESLTYKDKVQARPLIGQIVWCLDREQTPSNFSYKHLMYNGEDVLKQCKTSLSGYFDYPALERFAIKSAGAHVKVFKYIMEKSGLSKHPYVSFFRETFELALSDDKTDVGDLAAFQRHQIDDPIAVKKAKRLKEKVAALHNSIMKKLGKQYEIENHLDVSKEVVETLKERYASTGTVSTLWPTLKADAVKHVSITMNLKEKS